jgi:uncharacterized protein YabN with tetrapyrrole methylase and pyrophosphatase domain
MEQTTQRGSLVVVGTGISVGHLTAEARGWLSVADKVLYCVADAATERLILQLNSTAESLYGFYGEGKERKITYQQMVERTMECVRSGQTVCVAYYGHPGLFVNPSYKSLEIARQEGHTARMLPAVSSLDCLFCDLNVDPSAGCQIFEATDVMLRRRALDAASHVIILQVSALGDMAYSYKGYDSRNVPSLGLYLAEIYPGDFEVISYEAAQFATCEPVVRTLTINDLVNSKADGVHTLYIPPLKTLPVHLSAITQYGLNYLLDGVKLVPVSAEIVGSAGVS